MKSWDETGFPVQKKAIKGWYNTNFLFQISSKLKYYTK